MNKSNPTNEITAIEELRTSEEKYSRSFHLAPISLTITTLKEGTIVEVNDEFLRNTGYKREEILGQTVFDINIWEPPEDRNTILPPLRKGNAIKNLEIIFRHKNGDLHNYIFSAEPINVDGTDCIISNFFDITEKKKLEDALRHSEQMYKTIFEISGSAMAILREDIIILANKSMTELTGFSKAELEGIKKWQDFLVPECVREINKFSSTGKQSLKGIPDRHELKIKDRFGNRKDVICLNTFGPNPSEYVITLIDLTEYKHLLKQLNQISNREQLRIGELLHDNLIQYLTGTSLIVRSLELKKQSGNIIDKDDLRKIHTLITDSLDLTKKLLKGLFLVEIDYEGLPNALNKLCTSVNELHNTKCRFTDKTQHINIDVMKATEIYYIANEAIHNAVKHAEAGTIDIILDEQENNYILKISDNGRGIDPETAGSAEGIGLKLMRFRANMINANLRIRNSGAGTEITLNFRKKREETS